MTDWIHVVWVLACIVLFGVFVWGIIASRKAVQWCKRQRLLIDQARSAPPEQPSPEEEADLSPNPLRERQALLEKMAQTSLAEGDIGSFLLRRDEVPGQNIAALFANALVSSALFFTILGLIFTLWGLGSALSSSSFPDAQSDLVETLVDRIQGPLSHLPFLFIPTALGLLLAVVTICWRQRSIDEQVEKTWQEIDRYTQEELLPRFLTRSHVFQEIAQRQEVAIASLSESSVRFEQAASRMEETFGTVQQALSELSKLDQSRWAQDLMKAAQDFREQVRASGQVLSQASREIHAGLQTLPAASQGLEQAAGRMAEAGEKVAQAGSDLAGAAQQIQQTVGSLAEVQQQILELGGNISSLATGMQVLNGHFVGWAETQQQLLVDLKRTVMELRDAVGPLVQQASALYMHIHENAQVTQKALHQAAERFSACNEQLAGICRDQQATFGELSVQIANSLREGHQRFLAEVNGRFDQGEGLYRRLEDLRSAVDHNVGALKGVEQQLITLPSLLEVQRSAMETTERSLRQLPQTLQEVSRFLQEQATQSQQREERWWLSLEEQAQQQTQVLERTLRQLSGVFQEISRSLREQATQSQQREERWWLRLEGQAQQQIQILEAIRQEIQAGQVPWWKKMAETLIKVFPRKGR